MRPIDADALLKDIEQEYSNHYPTDRDIMDCVRFAPTIDPVKHGRWVIADTGFMVCSECKEPSTQSPYCPHCGAKMIPFYPTKRLTK